MSIQASKAARKAVLVLSDGTIFNGLALGAKEATVGNVIFHTAMTGYQEVLSDPSNSEHIVCFTYPHIGNYGINSEDFESNKAWVKGLILRENSLIASNFRSEGTLEEYLIEQNVSAIYDIDTRRLTRYIREKGVQAGCIMSYAADEETPIAAALELAKQYQPKPTTERLKETAAVESTQWDSGSWTLEDGFKQGDDSAKYHVVAFDFGTRRNMLRPLIDLDCRVTLMPVGLSADEYLAQQPDGFFIGNGPGDPADYQEFLKVLKKIVDTGIPILGTCLGHQLLARVAGANTSKMKFGHYSASHPVIEVESSTVMMTKQNHSYVVNEKDLPSILKVTHYSLFDRTIQGLQFTNKPIITFQGYPDARPGSQGNMPIYESFIELVAHHQQSVQPTA